MIYLYNKLPLELFPTEIEVIIEPTTIEEVKNANFISIVDDEDMAMVIENKLEVPIKYNPSDITFAIGDILYIPRFAEEQEPEWDTLPPYYLDIEWFIKIILKSCEEINIG